jgi:archaellum component FlaG (FlaF/FlaG flagellin family)
MALTHPQRIARALIKIIEDPGEPTQNKLDATAKYIELVRDKTKVTRARTKGKTSVLG